MQSDKSVHQIHGMACIFCNLISAVDDSALLHRKWNTQTASWLVLNSEWNDWILNGTSAKLGYTVSFILVHAGKNRTGDKLRKTDTTKTEHNSETANNTKHSKRKLSWFSRFLRGSARKRSGLSLQGSWAHTGPYTSAAILIRQAPSLSTQSSIKLLLKSITMDSSTW